MAPARHRVECINKDDRLDPYTRITHIGGSAGGAGGNGWKITQAQAIEGIESDRWAFYVQRGGHEVDVVVAVSRFGNKYIKTTADGDSPDNLLSLPECPK